MLATVDQLYNRIRATVLALPSVVEGTRFGMPAWFVDQRFFAHCHRGRDALSLEALLDKREVKGGLPGGVLPHPQYAGFGWVRLVVRSEAELATVEQLLRQSHAYMTLVRRVWVPRQPRAAARIQTLRRQLAGVALHVRRDVRKKRDLVVVTSTNRADPAARQKVAAAVKALRALSR